jgi:hypothetical protein
MANVKVYEIASSASPNSEKLFSPDQRHFYWNDKKFRQMSIGEKVFFINRDRTKMYSLFTEIDRVDIPAEINDNNSFFADLDNKFVVTGKFEKFIRFKIIEKREIGPNWQWKTLGATESTYLDRDNDQAIEQNTKENNILRINQLLKVYRDPDADSHKLLISCKNKLEQPTTGLDKPPKEETKANKTPPPLDPLDQIIQFVKSKGFIFEPWQVAAYITALKTKPFVILAGVSGTGKSKLPALIAEATGGISKLIPVRPDWTDSSDILGYCDLPGKFRPGQLLEIIREAHENKNTHYVCIIDEMNLARVEHYLAEILSRIEDRREAPSGGFESRPILTQKLADKDKFWEEYVLPPNLAIVGTVNMDESAHGFSRKVLDRAFTIELSDIDLEKWESSKSQGAESIKWPVNKWYPLAIQPGKLKNPSEGDRIKIKEVIDALTEINGILVNAQLQVGYRTRDEIIMFVLHAQEFTSHFDSGNLKPLDLALQMKILPRIVGGSSPIRHVVLSLLGWAYNGQPFQSEEDAQSLLDEWIANGRAGSIKEAHYPHTSARLCLMLDRIKNEGFTSYWL